MKILLLCLLASLLLEAATASTTPAPAPTPTPLPTAVAHSRWVRQRSNALPSHGCEYKELMTNLHDRVAILATLDEDLRNRLESIEKKLEQIDTSSSSRIDSLQVRQMDFLKRLDSLELIQRMTRRDIEDFKIELSNLFKSTTTTSTGAVLASDSVNDILQRQSRETLNPPAEQSEKLEALAILLRSTFNIVGQLQNQLSNNLTRLMQTTSQLQRRLNTIQRRQHANGAGVYPPQMQTPQLPATYFAPPGNPNQLATSCSQGLPTSNGILQLQLTPHSMPFYVLCDENAFGGGWTIIQNRFNGDINFHRDWIEYRNGFGNLAGEFFIGLEKLHALTTAAVNELLIVLEDFSGTQRYARYSLFGIGDEHELYALNLLGTYNGNAGDALTYHAGSKFSTYDNDNDNCLDCNCAQAHMGAWWYNWCEMSNLNGKYFATDYENVPTYQGMYWHHFHGANYSLKHSRMMIRPVGADEDRRRR